jgi:hypothetical protein
MSFAKSTFVYNVASRAERHCINETISPVSLGTRGPASTVAHNSSGDMRVIGIPVKRE